MRDRYPLHQFVHGVLLKRLAMVALALVLALGGAAWWQVRHRTGEEAVTTARNRLEIVRTAYARLRDQGMPADEAVPEAVAVARQVAYDRSRGEFVFAVFYDETGDFHVMCDTTSAVARAARDLVGSGRSHRPALDRDVRWQVRVDGARGVQVVLPIAGRDGSLAAWVAAVYLLTPEASAAFVRTPLVAAGLVALIVLVTSALLYPVILDLARRLARHSGQLLEANLEMMEALGCAIAKRDGDTDAHNYRVTIYAVRLAEKEGLDVAAIQGLIKGAFLHDIGKIGIRDDVLLKPGRLTADEYAVMKTHVDHGVDIVGRSRWLHDALAIVGSHHEKYDGDGYPGRVPGAMIPTAARIFAITDVFDALSSPRPYKDALPLEKVVDILVEGRGTHFDPVLLGSFLEIAPALHAELTGCDTQELRARMAAINDAYFNAGLETLLA